MKVESCYNEAMKLSFIALNSQYIHSCLSLQSLAELAKPYGQVSLLEASVNQEYRSLLATIEPADIYFFSAYIWNRRVLLDLLADLRQLYPQAKLLVGGPEAQGAPDDFLEWCDGVFLGEGETPLIDYLSGRMPPSLHRKNHPGIIHREECLDFAYPFDWVDPTRIVYYESQRGCPYHCSYCMSAEVDRLVDAPLDKVKRDLDRLVDLGARLIKLTDRSFNAKSERCLALIKYFGSFSQDVTFHVELSPYGLNRDQIEAMRRLPKGRLQVEVGFQASQGRVLQAIDRPSYSKRVLELLEELMALPMHRHIDLIAGLPGMGLTEVAETFDYLFSLSPDDLQVGFLKVLPGSPLGRQAKRLGLISSASPPYEILQTPSLSFTELNLIRRIAQLAGWLHPGDFPATFDYLAITRPFDFYRRLIDDDEIGDRSLEDRLRRVQQALGDEVVKEYMEIDYRRRRRHRKHLFFHGRRVGLRDILNSRLIEQIRRVIPDLDETKLEQRIGLYRTNTDQPYVLYDYQRGETFFLGE